MAIDVALSDVENVSIAGIWLHIYKHLDWKEAVRGRAICATLRRELPRVVTDLTLRCFANAAQRQYQLRTVASTFTQLRTLELLAPHCITPEAVEKFMDWRQLLLPHLQELTVHTDVADDIQLLSTSLPSLQKLVLVSKDTNAPVSNVSLHLPGLTTLKFIAMDFLSTSIPSLQHSLATCTALKVLEFAYCGLSRQPYCPAVDEGVALYLPQCQELFFDRCHLRAGVEVEGPRLQVMRVICRDPPGSDQLTHLRLWPNDAPPGNMYHDTGGGFVHMATQRRRGLATEDAQHRTGQASNLPDLSSQNTSSGASAIRQTPLNGVHEGAQVVATNEAGGSAAGLHTDLRLPRIDLKVFTTPAEPGLDAATLRHLQHHPRVSLVLYVQTADMWGDPEPFL